MDRKDKLLKLAEDLMKFGSDFFDKEGPDELMPMFIGEDEKGQKFIIGTPFSSDREKVLVAEKVREFFIEKQMLRYAFLSEGWARFATPEEMTGSKRINPKVAEHEDRRESLTVVGNDGNTDVFMNKYILRPERGKPCLVPGETLSSERSKKFNDENLFGNLLAEKV